MIGRYWRKAAVRESEWDVLYAIGPCAKPKRSGAILTSVIMGARLGPAELESGICRT